MENNIIIAEGDQVNGQDIIVVSPASKNYVAAKKIGRCFNGFHRDSGTVIHLVPAKPPRCGGDWFDKALCGTMPGLRGNGWTLAHEQTATCPKCIKKKQLADSKILPETYEESQLEAMNQRLP